MLLNTDFFLKYRYDCFFSMMYLQPVIVVSIFMIAYGHQHQQPYQPPQQPAYQQQVPQHAHPQPTGHPPQGGQAQPNLLRDKTHVQDRE